MSKSVFWEAIRNNSGWGWALGEMGRRPGAVLERGPRFDESPLHWAMLGHLEATSKICQDEPGLLGVLDSQDRSAMDWAIEKIYFLKERQEGELPAERARTGAMMEQARSCAWFALNWCLAQGVAQWTGSVDRWIQWALTAGELALARAGEGLGGRRADPSVWLCGLAGIWSTEAEARLYVESLAERGLDCDAVVFGRPLGLHVAALWAEGRLSSERAAWLHKAGLRLDQETQEESVELFCGRQGAPGALRWDAMAKKLDL